MAFATKVGTAQWNTSAGGATTAQKATMPAGIQAGDLILVCWVHNADNTLGTLDAKWTDVVTGLGTSNRAVRVVKATAVGTETGDLALVTLGTARDGASTTYVFRNWDAVEAATLANQAIAANNPDPPSFTPSFGSRDTTWIAVAGANAGVDVSSAPANYSSAISNRVTGSNPIMATAERQNATATEDPGTFTMSGSGNYIVTTIAVAGFVTKTGLDETGAGTDALALNVTPPSSDETGVGTDALSVAISTAISGLDETGAGTDGFSAAVQAAVSGLDDTGTGTDNLAIEAFSDLTSGKLWIGRFVNDEPAYTISNEIISYNHTDEGNARPNVVSVDGEDDSWTEYDRGDLVTRDEPINAFLDLPELRSPGDVRQRAVEEIEEAHRASSPGGTVVWDARYTRMDRVYWIDEFGSKYETRIEGISVEFDQSLAPYQRVTIDTGLMVLCPPDEAATYLVRDLFDRVTASGLGVADTGGAWSTDGSPGPVVVTFDVAGETYRVLLQDEDDIVIAHRLLAGDPDAPKIPGGTILRGVTGVNTGYSWSIDPASVNFVDVSAEAYDGLPSMIESGEFLLDRYAPWDAEVIAIEPYS